MNATNRPAPSRRTRAGAERLAWLGIASLMLLSACKTDAECRKSCGCKTRGACSSTGQRCAAEVDADCRASQACALRGACVASKGKCVVVRSEDCRNANVCRVFGRCEALDGQCRDPRGVGTPEPTEDEDR